LEALASGSAPDELASERLPEAAAQEAQVRLGHARRRYAPTPEAQAKVLMQ
jgi:hypothetical protein